MKLPELKTIMKLNNVIGYSHYNKPEIVALLIGRGLLTEEDVTTKKPEKVEKDINPRFPYLWQIQKNPKKVEIRDVESGQVVVYSSIYKASRALNKNPGLIKNYNGKVWRKRYAIKLLDDLRKENENISVV